MKQQPQADERIDIHTNDDRYQNHIHIQRYRFTLERLQKEDHLLEVGTGLGVFSEMIIPKVSKYHGIEYDPETCLTAQRRVGDKSLIDRGDAQKLAFADHSFDCVVCLEVLEHLPDFRSAVSEARRVLKSGGRYIVSVPYRKIGAPSKTNPHHLYEPGEDELLAVLRNHFSSVEVYYQRYEETALMSIARCLRARTFIGLVEPYRQLTRGHPVQLAKIRLDSTKSGMILGLVTVGTL
jgi:ubiquinone/menaquinone biosynthesis C-methylase UbiE